MPRIAEPVAPHPPPASRADRAQAARTGRPAGRRGAGDVGSGAAGDVGSDAAGDVGSGAGSGLAARLWRRAQGMRPADLAGMPVVAPDGGLPVAAHGRGRVGRVGDEALALRQRAEAAALGLDSLMLAAERLVAAALPGAHGQRRAGMGEAFWQYRPAMSGDGAHAVDWRRSARSDTLYLREREAQTPRQAVLWVDGGPGMIWASTPDLPLKADRARVITLALALALLRGGERAGLLGGPAGTGRHQADVLARGLLAPGPLDPAGLRAGQVVVLASDWLAADLDELRDFLAHAAGLGVKGVLVQVLDPAEAAFPFAGAVAFHDPAGHELHQTRDAGGLRAGYLARLAERQARLAALAAGAGWQFGHVTSDQAPAAALIWLAGAVAAS